jgi:PAS domain-containing protein
MKDPCIQCDSISERNTFLSQYRDQPSEILADARDNSLGEPVIPALSEGRLKLLAEAAFEEICVHDRDLILDANPQFAEMFGYSLDEIKGINAVKPDLRQQQP